MTGTLAKADPPSARLASPKHRFDLSADKSLTVPMTAALSWPADNTNGGTGNDVVFGPFPGGKPMGADLAIDEDLAARDAQSDNEAPEVSPSGTDVSFQCYLEQDSSDSLASAGGVKPGDGRGGAVGNASGTWRDFREAGGRGPGGADASFNAYMPHLAYSGEHEAKMTVEESMKQQAMAKLTPRFTLSDIAQNPELARAAKLELAGQQKRSDGTSNLSSCDAQSRVTEIEHIRFTTDTADRDAGREVQAGLEQVDVLQKRLAEGRRSVEQMLKFIQKLYDANVAYSRAMMDAARAAVSSLGMSDSWKCASEGISELPMVVGGAHSQISQALAECTAKLQGVLKTIKTLSDELAATSAKMQAGIAAKRSALAKAMGLHEKATQAFGASEGHVSRPATRSLDKQKDPWLTEGQLAAGHADLLEAQYELRNYLACAFLRCRDVEVSRLQVTKVSMAAVLRSHGPAFEEQVGPFVTELSRVVGEFDPDHEVADLMIRANVHEDSALALGTQRKEEKTLMVGDLFSSPDIVRQGELEMWEAGDSRWRGGHFVVTQSGFLYGFLGSDRLGPVPTCSMCLPRCSFEDGDAPVFSITEGGTGWRRSKGRIVKLRAPSVDECCEWAIVVRETIASLQARW